MGSHVLADGNLIDLFNRLELFNLLCCLVLSRHIRMSQLTQHPYLSQN